MREGSYLSQSLKIGIIIFIPLGILISLFPPFNWDIPSNRKDIYNYLEIRDFLPLKKYSFIFDGNKKIVPVGTVIFGKKYYQQDSVKLKKVLSDAIEFQYWEGIDTFYNYEPVAYEIKINNSQSEFTSKLGKQKPKNEIYYAPSEFPDSSALGNQRRKDEIYYAPSEFTSDGVLINQKPKDKIYYDPSEFTSDRKVYTLEDLFEKKDDIIKRAKNYNDIKERYLKNPDGWDVRYNKTYANSKIYYQYTIKKPNYYLLQRTLILSELFVNYLLAFFVSIGIGLIFKKFRL